MTIHSKYSCLGSPKNRGAQWVAVRGVAKNQTQLSMYIHRQQKVQGSETGIASGVRVLGYLPASAFIEIVLNLSGLRHLLCQMEARKLDGHDCSEGK